MGVRGQHRRGGAGRSVEWAGEGEKERAGEARGRERMEDEDVGPRKNTSTDIRELRIAYFLPSPSLPDTRAVSQARRGDGAPLLGERQW